MSGTQAIPGAARSVLFQIDPDTVALPGIDFEVSKEDPLYSNAQRNKDLPVDEALVVSVMRLGVLAPVNTIKAHDRVCVLVGNQRIRAAREANKRLKAMGQPPMTVRCQTPERGRDDAELGECVIAENEIRQDNSPMVKAELAAMHLNRCGGNFAEAAKAFRLGEQSFRNLIKLKEADKAVRKAVNDGKLSTSAAIEIAGLPQEKQAPRLEELIAAGGTLDEAKRIGRKERGTDKTSRPTASLIKALLSQQTPDDITAAIDLADPDDRAVFFRTLEWVIGNLPATGVSGLEEMIGEVKA